MKPYLPVTLVAAIAAIVVFLGGYFVGPAFQSSQQRLNEQVQEKVEQATAMLGTYDPADATFYRLVQAPSTQPAEPVEADYSAHLQGRSDLIGKALAIAGEAVSLRDESSEDGAGGATNPVATRLETILVYDQADVLRRQAQARRAQADAALATFEQAKRDWEAADAQVRGLEMGLTRPGIMLAAQPAPAVSPEPSEAAAPELAAPEPAAKPKAGLFSGLVGKAFGKSAAPAKQPAPKPAKSTPKPKPTEAPPAIAAAPATAPAPLNLPPACILDPAYVSAERQAETIAQRIANLQLCKREVGARLQEAESNAGQLRPVIQDLTTRSQAAKARADEAQKKMLALEQAGVDATDPDSLRRFTADYRAASDDYRKATRELAILTSGISEQPALSEREREVLSDPVIAVDASIEKTPHGLSELTAELQTKQALIDTQKALLAQIDVQIERLGKAEGELKQQLARELQRRSEYAKKAAAAAREIVAAASEADKLEAAALQLAEGRGKQAAQRSVRAAETYTNAAKNILSEHPDAQNPRLDMIQKQRYLVGHAKAVGGDVDYVIALIQLQRSERLAHYQRVLGALQQMGVDAAGLLPEGATASEETAWLVKADAAQKAAEAARTEAVKAGQAALEQYGAADGDLNRLWMLHANMGAVHYLLAGLTSGPDADKELAEARKEYDMATRDRRDRPEGREYQGILDSLASARKAAK